MIKTRYVVSRGEAARWLVTDRAVREGRAIIAEVGTQEAALTIAQLHETERIAELARTARIGGLDAPGSELHGLR